MRSPTIERRSPHHSSGERAGPSRSRSPFYRSGGSRRSPSGERMKRRESLYVENRSTYYRERRSPIELQEIEAMMRTSRADYKSERKRIRSRSHDRNVRRVGHVRGPTIERLTPSPSHERITWSRPAHERLTASRPPHERLTASRLSQKEVKGLYSATLPPGRTFRTSEPSPKGSSSQGPSSSGASPADRRPNKNKSPSQVRRCERRAREHQLKMELKTMLSKAKEAGAVGDSGVSKADPANSGQTVNSPSLSKKKSVASLPSTPSTMAQSADQVSQPSEQQPQPAPGNPGDKQLLDQLLELLALQLVETPALQSPSSSTSSPPGTSSPTYDPKSEAVVPVRSRDPRLRRH